jgi:hypothetical protein
VLNLRLYPADVKCRGSITSNPPLIEFSCSNSSGASPTAWEASVKGLSNGMAHTFSPCALVPTPGASGIETIKTEVTIDWPVSSKKKTLSRKIEVDT